MSTDQMPQWAKDLQAQQQRMLATIEELSGKKTDKGEEEKEQDDPDEHEMEIKDWANKRDFEDGKVNGEE